MKMAFRQIFIDRFSNVIFESLFTLGMRIRKRGRRTLRTFPKIIFEQLLTDRVRIGEEEEWEVFDIYALK